MHRRYAMSDNLDLNLLRVFEALMDTGSVSGAAARLHLSVPATSRALGRLRRDMDDPIMVRAGRGLVPTPFAIRSAGRVKAVLEGAAELLTDTPDSEPHSWRRSFAVRINDGLAPVLATRLIGRIASEAPGVSLRYVADDSDHPDALRDGSIDLDIGLAEPLAPDVKVQELGSTHYVALVSAGSTLGRGRRLTVDQLCRYPHIGASWSRAQHLLDDALDRIGLSRRVIAVVPTYAVAALLAFEDDVIALVPGVLARHLVDRGVPVRWHDLPLELPSVTVHLRWHRRMDGDRASRWLRGHIAASLKDVAAD
jgi:DNA-binding transcriptional LysR family regulator